ncbi:S8 family serine peptidase [Candidatus Woesearchaeota archaeon]|nr:S8 family serine peptidase [Candidatus Woesearchaeota archaeon]
MRKRNFTMIMVFWLLLAASVFLFEFQMTGFAVRSQVATLSADTEITPDALESLNNLREDNYIVSLEDYDGDIEDIYKVLPGSEIKELKIINAVAVKASTQEIVKISGDANITKIRKERPIVLHRSSVLNQLNITSIRNDGPSDYNMTGQGIRIGIIDTGVDYTHPEFNCTPGEAGCFIKRSVSAVDDAYSVVQREASVERFSDNSYVKILDLSSGNKTIGFRIFGNYTIHSATFVLNDTSADLSMNGTALSSASIVDMSSLLSSEDCLDDECYFEIELSGDSIVQISDLSIDYSFDKYQHSGIGTDYDGHGTQISGIIHSTIPDAELYVYSFFDESGSANEADMIAALELAYYDDLDILSMSVGVADDGTCDYEELESLLQRFYDKNTLLVAASGNTRSAYITIPACFDNVVAIGSTDDDFVASDYHSYLGNNIEFAMPGENINTTNITTDPTLYTDDVAFGTSYSTPFAASMFAMVMEKYKGSTGKDMLPHQVRNFSAAYARDIYVNGKDNLTGYGVLQASYLMSNMSSVKVFADKETPSVSQSSNSLTLDLTSTQSTTATISADAIDVNGDILTVLIDGQSSKTIELPETIYIDVLTSNLSDDPTPGTYSTSIEIDYGDKTLVLPLNFAVQGNLIGHDYDVGYFSLFEKLHGDYEIAYYMDYHGQPASDIYNYEYAFNSWTRNRLDFQNITNGTYEINSVYNVGDYFYPILKVDNSSLSNISSYYITIVGPSDSETLMNSTPYANAVNQYDPNIYYLFSLYPSDITSVETLSFEDPILDTNMYKFLETGTYTVKTYADIGSSDVLLEEKTLTVLDNLSIEFDDEVIEKRSSEELDLKIRDNRRVISGLNIDPNHTPNLDGITDPLEYLSYNSTYYGDSSFSITVDGDLIDSGLVNSSTDIDSSSIDEGVYLFELNYSSGDNSGNLTRELAVLYPLEVTIVGSEDELSTSSNLSYLIYVNKSDGLVLNGSTYTIIGFYSYCDIDISNYTANQLTDLDKAFYPIISLPTDSPVSESCTLYVYAEGSYEEDDEYIYRTLSSANFTILGVTPNITITQSLDDSKVYLGEDSSLTINLSNSNITGFDGQLKVNIYNSTGSKQLASQSISLDESQNKSYLFSVDFDEAGTSIIETILNNSAIYESDNLTVTVNSGYITSSATKNLSEVHINDSVKVTITLKNNNNEDADVTLSLDSYSDNLDLESGSTSEKTIPSSGTDTYVYELTADESGSASLNFTIYAENLEQDFEYKFTINPGVLHRINLTDSFKKYEIGLNDTLTFMVDDNCTEVYDTCNDMCDVANDTCKDSCRYDWDSAKDEYSLCKNECNVKYDDSDDRSDCRDECKDDRDDAEEEYNECNDECRDEALDCMDICYEDYDECTSDAVDVEVTALHERDDEEIELEFIGEDDFTINLEVGDEEFLDLDDDGMDDVHILLYDLIEDEDYTCEDDCKDVYDEEKQLCTDVYNNECVPECDSDTDCKDDCRDDRDDCREDSDDNYDDCLDECELVYSDYEIKIKRMEEIEPEIIIPQINQSINGTNNTNSTNESIPVDPDPLPQPDPDPIPDPLPQPEPEPTPLCSVARLDLCTAQSNCELNEGYWYSSKCNANPQPIIEPDEEEPKNGGNIWLVILVIMIVLGLGAGGFIYLRSTTNAEDQFGPNAKREQLMDYFMKQLEKGNNLEYIIKALKKLGWDAAMVDEVAVEISNDTTRQMAIQIVKFANEYSVTDPEQIQQRFQQYGPEIVNMALNEMMKRR